MLQASAILGVKRNTEQLFSEIKTIEAGTKRGLIGIVVALLLGAFIAWAGSQGSVLYEQRSLFALCIAIAFVIQWLAFVPSFLFQTEHYYDVTGSFTYLSVIACALIFGGVTDPRALLIAVLAGVWALRLGSFLFLRIRKDGSDSRFDPIKPNFTHFLMAWTLQGLWVSLTLAAGLAAMTSMALKPLGVLAVIGAAVWLAGFMIEVRADAQKRQHRANPDNRGKFISTGLWAWSRHPNYFGEITLWVGIALIALPALSGWQYATLISPVFVYLLLTKVSGIPMLEAKADATWGDDPAYQSYKNNTPVLMLRKPRD